MAKRIYSSDEYARHQIISRFRQFLKGLGFKEISIVCCDTNPTFESLYSVHAFDLLSYSHFHIVYSVDDMDCICRSAKIFWRYLK